MEPFHISGQNAGHAMLHMMVEIMSDNAVIMKTLAAIKANADQSKAEEILKGMYQESDEMKVKLMENLYVEFGSDISGINKTKTEDDGQALIQAVLKAVRND